MTLASAPAQPKENPLATIRVGIVGLGRAGEAMIPAIEHFAGTELTAVADASADALDVVSDMPGVDTHTDLSSLCASPNVDLVYVATPTHLHHEHASAALAAGKHVIVEKPMAANPADAEDLIRRATLGGKTLIVGHSRSFDPAIQAMRDVIRDGWLGPVRMINTWYYTDWMYRPRHPDELNPALGGGVLYRQGAHQVDILRFLAGSEVRSVRASTGDWATDRPGIGAHVLFLEFETGVVATAVFNGYDHFHSSEVTFDLVENEYGAAGPYGAARKQVAASSRGELDRKGRVGAETLARMRATDAPGHHSMYGLTVVSCERGDIRQSPGGLYVYGEHERCELAIPADITGRDLVLQEAYDAIVRGIEPLHDGTWGKANLDVCRAAEESTRLGREVFLTRQPIADRGWSSPRRSELIKGGF